MPPSSLRVLFTSLMDSTRALLNFRLCIWAALRELEEETGYTAERLEWIRRFSWAPRAMGGTVEIFFTKALKPKGDFNPNEIMDIELVSFEKVLERVLRGEYIDSALVIATLLVSVKKLLDS